MGGKTKEWPSPKLSPPDLLAEALSAVVARPGRSFLTMIGTVLGVGSLVVILSLTTTVQSQISSKFDRFTATSVTIDDVRSDDSIAFPFTPEAETRAAKLNGVSAVGTRWSVQLDSQGVSTWNVPAQPQIQVLAATPGYWTTIGAHFDAGGPFSPFHERAASNVVVLGASAARQLGIGALESQPTVAIADEPYSVIGIVDDVRAQSDTLLSVVIPTRSALKRWGSPTAKAQATMTISTRLGAATQVAREAPLAVAPAELGSLRAVPPPDPKSLRNSVNTDLSGLLLALGAVCLAIGAVGIANTTLIAVFERTGEIGLRRSLGARRRHISAQIMTESGMLGMVGGALGAGVGVLVVLGVSVAQHWAPVVDPMVAFASPLVGMVTGVLAGIYPAWRGAQIEPTEALRS